MKTTITFLSFLLISIVLTDCSPNDSNDKFDSIYLRITNNSKVNFNSVYVSFPGAETTFENVFPGKSSDYQKLENAYRYGYIKIESGDKNYVLQPIDFVGEKTLKNGKYTYQLGIDGESLTLNFMKD